MGCKVLFCDINIKKQGHYLSYDQFIISHLASSSYQYRDIVYLFNLSAKELIDFSNVTGKVMFIELNPEWFKSNLGKFKIWNAVKKIAEEQQINHLLFMDYDQYQLPIGFSKVNYSISGIYFRPHHRIESQAKTISEKLGHGLKRTKKIILEKILLANKNVKKIFILNDHEGVKTLNNYHNTKRFFYLPDPIFDYEMVEIPTSEKQATGLCAHKVFLVFGSISERKNVTNILKAFKAAQLNTDACLVIAGPCSESYMRYLSETIQNLNFDGLRKKITIINRYTSDGEMEYFHSLCDVSLLIYKDFYGSSGLIGRAAKHQKFVIGTSLGLISNLINEYNLGSTANPESVEDIAIKMEESLKQLNVETYSGHRKFYEEHRPNMFTDVLLKFN